MKRQGEKNRRNKNQKGKQIRVAVIKKSGWFFLSLPRQSKNEKDC